MSATDLTGVGFIGLGNMGGPMALNLTKAGFPLTVFDISPDRTAPLLAAGARVAANARGVVECADVVVTMLPDTPDVEGVVEGEGGILVSGRAGLLHMDMSTINPNASRRLAARHAERGMGFVDAAVGRSAIHAARGESLFMVGADRSGLDRVRPLLEAMGTAIVHCGPPGSGIAMKIVNNFLGNVQAQVTAEALALGVRLGLSADLMVEVLSNSLSVNGFLTEYYPAKALVGDVEPGFALRLALKDLTIAVGLAGELDVPVVAGAAARSRVEDACAHFGDKDVTALVDAAAAAAGVLPVRLAKAAIR